ncbi:MAG: DUF3857 domain-containing protein [Bacteroidales bacterium]
MKYLIALSLNFILMVGLFAQLPKSDAVFEKIVKEYTLNDDGSIDFHYYKKLKLLTHYSFNRLYGETFIVYHPDFQSLKINFANVTQQDGTVVASPHNAFNEVLPGFAKDAPYFNQLREMVVTHAGVELDAVIELDYTLHTEAGYYPALMADEIITELSPVQEELIIVRLPAGQELNFKVFNLRTGPQITEENNMNVYTFTFQGIAEESHESHQQGNKENLPRLTFSTFTMDAARQFLAGQEGLNYKTSEKMQDYVRRIKAEKPGELLEILKIQEMVANDINTYNIPGTYSAFKARNPIETWNSNGGTPFEKCLLLVSLLREAGVNAEPVAIVPTALYNENVGCLPLLNDYLVQANPRELEQMYLSPTHIANQNLIYSLNDHTLLLLKPGNSISLPIVEAFENKIAMNGEFMITDSMKIEGSMETAVFERTNPYYDLKREEKDAKKLLGGGLTASDIKSFELVNCAQTRSLVKYAIEKKEPMENKGIYYFFELPVSTKGTEDWNIHYLNPERDTPLEIPFPVNEQYSYAFTMPANTELVNPMEEMEISNDLGQVILFANQKGNKVTIKRMFVLNQTIIPTNQFDNFKAMLDKWNDKNYKKLILKK